MQIPIKLSEHFSLQEAVSSDKAVSLGIDNTDLGDDVIMNAIRTAGRMETVRSLLNCAVHVDSWIRCLALNRAVGSKDTSQHILGEAVDFIAADFGTPLDICRAIIAAKPTIGYDQLILEHTWVHISFCAPDCIPRGHVLSLLATGSYAVGLTDTQGKPFPVVS